MLGRPRNATAGPHALLAELALLTLPQVGGPMVEGLSRGGGGNEVLVGPAIAQAKRSLHMQGMRGTQKVRRVVKKM